MSPLWWAVLGPAGVGLAVAAAVLWDRLREPHRDPTRPCAVVDWRTYRDARRRVERLVAAGDFTHAWYVCVAMCAWLASERHYGNRRRRERLAAELAAWTARRAEFAPTATA